MIITTIHLFFFNFIHLIFLNFRNTISLFYYTLCHIPCKIIHLTFLNFIPLRFIPLYIIIQYSIFIFSQDKKKDIIPFYSNNTDITSFFIFTHATIIFYSNSWARIYLTVSRYTFMCFILHIHLILHFCVPRLKFSEPIWSQNFPLQWRSRIDYYCFRNISH